MDALRQFNDGRVSSPLPRLSIGLEGDRITFGAGISLPLSKRDGFDEARMGALLTAAYGGSLPPSALAYIKGVVAKQREGQTPLALTYLALAGLPQLADPEAAAWRLSAADQLMKAGVAPSPIIDALTPRHADLERAYNPDQPAFPQATAR